MPGFNISRANNGTPKMTRKNVPVHALFQDVKNGRPTGTIFANLGKGDKLGKFFSIAPKKGSQEGALFGTANGNNEVAIVGKFNFEADLLARGREVATTRNTLKAGEIFQVPASRAANRDRNHKPPMYVHLGLVSNDTRTLSYNMNTKKLAIGTKLRGKVLKVGEVGLAKDMTV